MISLMMKSDSSPYSDEHEDSPGKKLSDHLEKRRIANSNERRRMQNINAGFDSLRSRLSLHDGQKYSKASILQHAAQHLDELQKEILDCRRQMKLYEAVKLNCTCGSFNRVDRSKVSEKCLESNLQDEGIGSPRDDDIDDLHRYEMDRQKSKSNSDSLIIATKPIASKFKSYKGIESQTVGTLRSVVASKAKTANENPNKKYSSNSPGVLVHEGSLRSPRLVSVQGPAFSHGKTSVPRVIITTGGKDTTINSPAPKLSSSSITTTAAAVKASCITLLSSNSLKTPLLSPVQKVKIEKREEHKSSKKRVCEPSSPNNSNEFPSKHKYTKVNIAPSTSRGSGGLNDQENHQPPHITTFKSIKRDDVKSVKRHRLIAASCRKSSDATPSQRQSIHISTLATPSTPQRQSIHISTLSPSTTPIISTQKGGCRRSTNTFLYKTRIKPVTDQPQQIIIPTGHQLINVNNNNNSSSAATSSPPTSSSSAVVLAAPEMTLNQLNLSYAPVVTDARVQSTSQIVVVHHSPLVPPTTGPDVSTTSPSVQVQSIQGNENSPCRIGHVEVVIQPDCPDEAASAETGTSSPMVNNNRGNQLNTILEAIDRLEQKEKRTTKSSDDEEEETRTNTDSSPC